MKSNRQKTVGEIVADNFENARIFHEFGIDFCCKGQTPFIDACMYAEVSPEIVENRLQTIGEQSSGSHSFKSWPLDLLIDYVIKYHHRNIRHSGRGIIRLLDKVRIVHGDSHPWLHQVCTLFSESIVALGEHLMKEELVLFPYFYELYAAQKNQAPLPSFHCGSAEAPISVMMSEHDQEGERFRKIAALSGNYIPPADACNSFRLVMQDLKEFDEDLHEHIHLENNIIFPRALAMQNENLSL